MNNDINVLKYVSSSSSSSRVIIASKRKKVPLLVYLPEDVDEKFRKYVALKYQKAEKGLISYEIELAINNLISVYNIQQSTKKSNVVEIQFFKVNKFKDEIIKYLSETHGIENPKTIIEKHLNEAIGQLRGYDNRTIKSWKKRLLENEFIIKSGSHSYDFL